MRILIINHNGGSIYHGPNLRTYYAAKELVKHGHHVTIVSSSYSHKYVVLPKVSGTINNEIIDGITYKWVKCSKYNNLLHRIYSHFEFGFKILFNKALICDKADLVIFSGPPTEIFLFSWVYAKMLHAPIISDIRDIWPKLQLELSKWYWLNPFTYFLYLCLFLQIHGSSRIVSPLPGIRNYLSKFGITNKIIIIENGYDLSREVLSEPVKLKVSACGGAIGFKKNDTISLDDIKGMKRLVVGYSGAFDRDNDIYSLIEAAKLMADRDDILFMFVGAGINRNDLIKATSVIQNLLVCDRVSSIVVPNVLSVMDVCYCGLRPKNIYQYGVSLAKSYEYMAAGKPILWMIEAFNNPVRDSGGGIIIEPGNVPELVKAIDKCTVINKEELSELGNLGFNFLKKNFSYKVLGIKWLNLILKYKK